MTITISVAHANARVLGTRDFMDTGSANARLRIYDGTRPAGGGAVTTLLVEIALDKPCGTVAGGVLTLASSDLPLVLNSGVATWARCVNGDDDYAWDADVSLEGGAGEVQLLDTTLFAGGKAQLIAGVLG